MEFIIVEGSSAGVVLFDNKPSELEYTWTALTRYWMNEEMF